MHCRLSVGHMWKGKTCLGKTLTQILQSIIRHGLSSFNHNCTSNSRETMKYNFVVYSLSHVQLFVTPWNAACQASPSITNSRSLLKLMSIKSVMPSNHLILCRSLLLLFAWWKSSKTIFKKETEGKRKESSNDGGCGDEKLSLYSES